MPVVIKNPQGSPAGYNTLAGLAALVGAIQNLQESGRAREQESLKLLLAQMPAVWNRWHPATCSGPAFWTACLAPNPPP